MVLSLKNSYTNDLDNWVGIAANSWVGEVFRSATDHRVVETWVKMSQNATLFQGAIRAAIYESDGTKPTGSPLITRWIDWTGLTTSWPPDTMIIDWGGGIDLAADTWYALVFSGHFMNLGYAPNVGEHMNGADDKEVTSTDGGSTWSTTNRDVWFQNWGDDATPSSPATHWLASRADCVALWRAEPWDLFSDQSGNGNHLWNASYARPSALGKDGLGSMRIAGGWAECRVADQSADFPLRNSTYNLITVTAWMAVAAGGLPSNGNYRDVVRKGSAYANFRVSVYNDGGTCRLRVGHGYNGGASWELATLAGLEIVEATWYHVTVQYDATTKALKIRVLSPAGVTEQDFTWTEDLNYNDDVWRLGGFDQFAGWLDRVALFNSIIPKPIIEKLEGAEESPRLDKRQHKWQCW